MPTAQGLAAPRIFAFHSRVERAAALGKEVCMYQKRSCRRFNIAVLGVVFTCVGGLYSAVVSGVAGLHTGGERTVSESVSAGAPSVSRTWVSLSSRVPSALLLPVGKPSVPTSLATPADVRAERLDALYEELSYGLDGVRSGVAAVPRVFSPSVPRDMRDVDVERRKSLFLRMLLPVILRVNEEIESDRTRLKRLIERDGAGMPVSEHDALWLEDKMREYRMRVVNMEQLLKRMDIVPPSIALAQAIEESGWGTSRFAMQGNALFGQWTPSTRGLKHPDPIAPGWRIASFSSLLDAVRSYVVNLNTHSAYGEFRSARFSARKAGSLPEGMTLAPYLHRYSERGSAYTQALRNIIRVNDLRAFDSARLSDRAIEVAALPDDLIHAPDLSPTP